MPKIEIITKSENETRKIGRLLAKGLRGREIICLEGDLGGGKTTFTQGIAKGLGVKQWPTSPTFVIIKNYQLPTLNSELIHIDCYRVDKKDLLKLDFKKILKSDKIKVIEWADKIKDILPKNCFWIKFEFVDEKTRKITFNYGKAILLWISNWTNV